MLAECISCTNNMLRGKIKGRKQLAGTQQLSQVAFVINFLHLENGLLLNSTYVKVFLCGTIGLMS